MTKNWYKLMIGTSLLMSSFGFMLWSISPAKADSSYSNYRLVPANADGSINVKLSDEQLNKIFPKNADGSINVRMAPSTLMDVNIMQIRGYSADYHTKTYETNGGGTKEFASLVVTFPDSD